MDNRSENESGKFDQIAVALSGLCLMHCLLLPLFITVLPFFGQFGDDHLHVQLLLVVLPVSGIALMRGFRRHGNRRIIASGLFGLLLLVVGGTIVHETLGTNADRAFTVAGSLILAATHFLNGRLSRNCGAVSFSKP